MSLIRAILILLIVGVFALPCMLIYGLMRLVAPQSSRRFLQGFWSFLARLTGTKVLLSGEPLQGGCLYAANLSSWLDVIVLGAVRPLSFVVRRSPGTHPLFELLARFIRAILLDRDSRQALRWSNEILRSRLEAGETLVLFPEGAAGDGNHVQPFKSALIGPAEVMVHGRPVPVQPVSIAYRGLWGLPLDRRHRPRFAWYGDMPFFQHIWGMLRAGPVDAQVIFHPPSTIDRAGGRKALARYCETSVSRGLAAALAGDRGIVAVSLWRQPR